jgi:hypothetical protein
MRLVSFCLEFLSDVLGVEVFLSAPTVSRGDSDLERLGEKW